MANPNDRSQQAELAHNIVSIYKDAIIKKIDRDNYLDIHIPSIHSKKGTHLFFNTGSDKIKLGFYCRDEHFIKSASSDPSIETYSSGLRPKGNPGFVEVQEAIRAAVAFLTKLGGVARQASALKPESMPSENKEVPQPKAPVANTVTQLAPTANHQGASAGKSNQQLDERIGNLEEKVIQLSRMLVKAFGYADQDPDTFLQNARRTTEAICRFLYLKEVGELKGKMMLNDYGRELIAKKVIPEKIGILIGTIQTYGNYGTHAQDDFSEATREWIAPCQAALTSLTNWFFLEYLKGGIPDDLATSLRR